MTFFFLLPTILVIARYLVSAPTHSETDCRA